MDRAALILQDRRKGISCSSIAKRLGVSASRVSQLTQRALRKEIEKKMPRAWDATNPRHPEELEREWRDQIWAAVDAELAKLR